MGLFDAGFGGRGGMSPAAIALLGLLAVKGFENRDKIAGALQGALGSNPQSGGAPTSGGLGGLLGGLGGLLGSNASSGSVISGGLGDLLSGFQKAGHGDVANSWVKDGPNQSPAPQQVEEAVGARRSGSAGKGHGPKSGRIAAATDARVTQSRRRPDARRPPSHTPRGCRFSEPSLRR